MTSLKATFVPFTAQTRMSGVDVEGSSIRKGAVDAVLSYVDGGSAIASGNTAIALRSNSDTVRELQAIADEIAKARGTPLAVARDGRLLGVLQL